MKDQANLTPSAAAALWPKLEAIAKPYNLKIAAPAVNYCGNCVEENGVTYTDPIKYLDDFFCCMSHLQSGLHCCSLLHEQRERFTMVCWAL
jgi:hypothetical protein